MRVVVLLAIGLFAAAEAAFNCKPEGDGFYAVGCSSDYVWCYMGKPLNYTCPASLKFNPDNAECDYDYNVGLCENKDINRNTIVKARKPFTCEGLEDDIYGTGQCTGNYYDCRGGTATKMPCPAGLFFRNSSKACDFRENTEECKGKQWRTPVSYLMPVSEHTEIIEPFSCGGKRDGVYTSHVGECVQHFWKCAHEETHLYRCPSGLYFNKHNYRCDHKHEVPECSPDWHHHHHHHEKYTPYHHHEDNERHGRHHYPHEHYEHPDYHHYNFKCYGKPDGSYAIAHCINAFAECSGGVTSYKKCSTGLVYAHDGPCVHMKKCEKHRSHPHVYYHEHRDYPDYRHDRHYDHHHGYPGHHDRHYDHHHGYTDYHDHHHDGRHRYAHHYGHHNDRNFGYLDHHPPLSFDCTNKKDGYHKIGHCHASFAMCSNGMFTEQHCPNGLVFHFGVGACDYHHNCINDVRGSWVSEKMMRPRVSLSCENRKDGPQHLQSCSSEFYLCWGRQAFSSHCPADLVYNKLNGHCDFKHNVRECSVPEQSVYHHQLHVEPHHHFQLDVAEKFCASKPDGTYADGCSQHYYKCVGGITHKQDCPPTLYYSESMKQCGTKENVPECKADNHQSHHPEHHDHYPDGHKGEYYHHYPQQYGGEYYHHHHQPQDSQQNPQHNEKQAMKEVKMESPKAADSEFTCEGKQDGYYANGCNSKYFACFGGHKTAVECPAKLTFDEKAQACEYSHRNPQCSPQPDHHEQPKPHKQAKHHEPHKQPKHHEEKTQELKAEKEETAVGSEAASPADSKKGFCSTHVDGIYANGCSPTYYICAAKTTFTYKCSDDKVFNQHTGSCDARSYVLQCKLLDAQKKQKKQKKQ